jgi:MSHA pilin protein MshC
VIEAPLAGIAPTAWGLALDGTRKMTRGSSLRNGFTLVEMTAVLVVLGLLAAIAIPRLISGDAFSSLGFYNASQAVVRYAQKVAVAQRRNVFVVVSAGGIAACYDAACTSRVPSPVDPTDPLGAHTNLPDVDAGGRLLWKNINAATLFLTPVSTFSFNGLGQPSSGAVIAFNSSVPGDPPRTITVTAETGYVY